MRLDLRPYSAKELVPFQACSQRALEKSEFASARCGLSEDGSLTWVYKGAVLEVVRTASGHTVTSLQVEHLLKDEQASIVQVCEFSSQGRVRLLVAVNGASEQGLVLLLDVGKSIIVKAVEVPHQVTAVERILVQGGIGVPIWAMSEQLKCFHGIVAVGTCGGYVYLVDMMVDNTTPLSMDSVYRPLSCPVWLLDPRERDMDTVRQQAVFMGQHVALRLGVDEQMNSNDCFHFRRPDLSVLQSYNEDEVKVSSLHYIPQTGTLAVGYSFGGFHLWKLYNPVLEYACPPEPEDLPVAYFVYQEPENDPKHFAYLWVGRDDCISEEKQDSLCSMSLYQLSYSRKTFYASYGYFYDELNSCVLRMDHVLTFDPYNSRSSSATTTSQLLSAVTITDPNYRPASSLTVNDSFDEGFQGPDLSLSGFVWRVQDSRPGSPNDIFLAIFDMNRWYHAQMPSRIKCVNVGGQEVCPFFAVYRMNESVEGDGHGALLGIHLKPGSLLRFVNNSPMPPEQHFYPSSLAFELTCVMSNGIVSATVLGVQRQVVATLELMGPGCLLKPFDMYHRCLQAGLVARSSDTFSATATSTDEQQRMALLTLALEHGKVRFITACIRSWADGEFFQQGCTLQFLLNWAWARVTAIKHLIDTTCQPLFNWCGAPVDQRMLQVLHGCRCSLGHVRSVLLTLLSLPNPLTEQGQCELEHRVHVVSLLHRHLRVILWFVHNSLLPENDEGSDLTPTHYVYPAAALRQVFEDRRRHIAQEDRNLATHDVILVDALVHTAGNSLVELWKTQGGTGLYPPPSLYAALSMLLLDGVDDDTKNAILIYLLFDMANAAHGMELEFAENIPKFVQAFDLQLSIMQQVHGFWLIDHMNFEEGIPMLLRHSSCAAIGRWQHGCILRALMLQGEMILAARYLTVCNPPVATSDDLKTRLTILVANRLVWQAVSHVRHSCGPTERETMLRHIFLQCQHRKQLELVFKLPLTQEEEESLQRYLSESADAKSAELLVLHLLQRAQYVPAIRLNDRIKHRAQMDVSAKARDRSKIRNLLVDGYRQSLPLAQRYLINNPPYSAAGSATRKIDIPRPKPLSTVITGRAEVGPRSQSMLVRAVLDKVAEARNLLAKGDNPDDVDMQDAKRKVPGKESSGKMFLESELDLVNKPGPFLCTPSTPRVHSRLSLAGEKVYPSILEKSQAALNTTTTAFTTTTTPPNAADMSRRSRVFTADCMSLLHTPKISRSPARPSTAERRLVTPHSILKVSRLPRFSPKSLGSKLSPRAPPKRLGFSRSTTASPSLPPTPTNISNSPTPSPTSADPPLLTSQVVASESEMSAVTPKHIRFAQDETREISPPYVSPDNLHRPPLHPDSQLEISAESSLASDEEITFNMSRQLTEPMDTGAGSSSSSATASPSYKTSPQKPAPPSSQPSPSLSPWLTSFRPPVHEPEESVDFIQTQKAAQSSETASERSLDVSPRPSQDLERGGILQAVQVEKSSESHGDRLSVSGEDDREVRRLFGDITRSPSLSLSPRSSILVSESVTTSSTRKTSESVASTSTERWSSVEKRSEEFRVSSQTTSTQMSASTSRTSFVVECEDEIHEGEKEGGMVETVMEKQQEEGEENLVEREEVHAEGENDPVSEGVMELSDVEDDEIQIPTPIGTPAHVVASPARSRVGARARQGRRGKFTFTSALDTQSDQAAKGEVEGERSEEKRSEAERLTEEGQGSNEESSGPTPPKLLRTAAGRQTRTSPARETRASPARELRSHSEDIAPSSEAQSVAEPAEDEAVPQVEVTVTAKLSPRRKSARRSVEHPSPPPSPSRRSSRASVERSAASRKSAEHSPPPLPASPSRRSSRKSDEHSPPPPSPSRRSARKSVDRSPPPASPSRRSTRKSSDSSPIPPPSPSRRSTRKDTSPSVKGASSGDEMPPPSPSRRSTRHGTPERGVGKVSEEPETPKSPGRSRGRPKKATEDETETPKSPGRRGRPKKVEEDETEAPKSPARRSSSRRSETPEPSPAPRSATRSKKLSEIPEDKVLATSQRSSQRSQSPEPASPARRSTRRSQTPEVSDSSPAPSSPIRHSTRRSQTPELVAQIASPSRRSARKAKTPERTTRTRKTSQAESSEADVPSAMDSEDPIQKADTSTSTTAKRNSPARSPGRPKKSPARSTRAVSQSSQSDEEGEEEEETAPPPSSTRSLRSPARSTRRGSESDDSSALRKSTRRSPGRSTTRTVSQSEAEEEEPVIEEKSTRRSPARSTRKTSQSEAEEEAMSEKSTRRSPARSTRSSSHEPAQEPTNEEEESSQSHNKSAARRGRGKSRTPERSTATHLRGKSKGGEGEGSEGKDVTMETEEEKEGGGKEDVPVPGPSAEETGDAPSFQFAAPTPLSRLREDPTLHQSADMSAFVFSPPISRSMRGASESSVTATQEEEGEGDESEPSTSDREDTHAEGEITAKRGRRATNVSRKKLKTLPPGASPSDSPINLVSPGEGTASPARSARQPARIARRGGVTRTRKLRKRQAKLW